MRCAPTGSRANSASPRAVGSVQRDNPHGAVGLHADFFGNVVVHRVSLVGRADALDGPRRIAASLAW